VLGDPEWARNQDFDTNTGRLAQQDAIDDEIALWTRSREREEVAGQLRDVGVPAGEVQRSSDLLQDAQYAHREFYRYLEHAEMGNVPYAGHQFRIQGYPSGARFPAPVLGQHSVQVLQELLGMSDDEIANAFAAGVIA
jgi:benzylsuccinate CoA-transferase BbsF subunit